LLLGDFDEHKRKGSRVAEIKVFVGLSLTQAEGQVFGIGCKIFTIAGPVILYGIFTSWLLGLIYWGLHGWGII